MSVPYYPQITITPNLGMSLVGMDVEVAENFILIDAAIGGGGGSSIKINGSIVANPNFNNTTPAAPGGNQNVTWQKDGSGNISGYVPLSASGNMLQVSNDNTLTWPTPQLNQYSPKYQFMPVGVSGTEGNATLTSNVLTVNVNHGYQVGETVTFTSVTGNFAFLNNLPIVLTGVTPPSSATITNIAVSGQTVTVTANNTFNAFSNDVVKLSGLTTNSWANGMTVSVTTRNATQFTFQWTAAIPAPFTPGAETGTATELLNSAFTANFTHANVATNVLAGGYCGTTVQPFLWMYDTFNQKWIDYAYVDSSVPAPGDPTVGSFAKLAFCRPVHFSDGTGQFSGIRQAGPVSIYHVTGNNENLIGADYFDVTLGIATDQTDSKVYSNIHQIYTEHRIKGAPVLAALATETAVTGARITVPDSHTNTWNVTWVAAINGVWNTVGTSNPNPFASGQAIGVLGQSNNGNSNASAGGTFVGVLGNSSGVAAAANAVGIGVRAQCSGHAVNYGVYIDAVSTGAGGLKGYNLVSFNGNTPNAGYVGIWGNIILPDTYSGIRLARFGDLAPANCDVAGKLAFSAATSASYTFANSYGTTPMVFICPENPGQVYFTVTTITTTGFTVTASASFTGNVSYFIIGRN